MSNFTSAFDEIYAVQTAELGVAILATVTGYGTNKPALLSGVDQHAMYAEGTTAEGGGYLLQIKASDLSSQPPKNTAVTCNGSATGVSLQIVSLAIVNAIYEISVADIQK